MPVAKVVARTSKSAVPPISNRRCASFMASMRSFAAKACLVLAVTVQSVAADSGQLRPVRDDVTLRSWLENMVWYHRFSSAEIGAVTGLNDDELRKALARFDIRQDNKPKRPLGAPLLVLPYPGGRHPRIGFLEGAVNPQRETKLSVFTPWDDLSYVVIDVPEAVWSNLGLTYLAHTHIDTIWTRDKISLPQLEWNRGSNGHFEITRTLPNGIAFGVEANPTMTEVRLRMWLRNGTESSLSDLRIQMCAMLKGATGFADQSNTNKLFKSPFAACRSSDGRRWIIHAWRPVHRVWGNAPCPCLHSDPKIPDCPPGETREAKGWLSFYEGDDLTAELDRINRSW